MTDEFKTKKIRVDALILSPGLPASYRQMLLGLTYRASLSGVPEQMLLDYAMAHPPIGVMGDDDYFHVISNVRTLAIKPHLPPETRIRVIEDNTVKKANAELISAQREMLNLIVSAIEGKHYTYAIAALREELVKNIDAKNAFASKIKSLATVAGLRRQSLSEITAHRKAIQPEISGGGKNV